MLPDQQRINTLRWTMTIAAHVCGIAPNRYARLNNRLSIWLKVLLNLAWRVPGNFRRIHARRGNLGPKPATPVTQSRSRLADVKQFVCTYLVTRCFERRKVPKTCPARAYVLCARYPSNKALFIIRVYIPGIAHWLLWRRQVRRLRWCMIYDWTGDPARLTPHVTNQPTNLGPVARRLLLLWSIGNSKHPVRKKTESPYSCPTTSPNRPIFKIRWTQQ